MNKTEKIICLILGAALVWCFMASMESKKAAEAARRAGRAACPQAAESESRRVEDNAPYQTGADAPRQAAESESRRAGNSAPYQLAPEKTAVIENDELRLVVTTHGGAVKSAILKEYAANPGEISEDNPPVEFDYSRSPLGRIGGVAGCEEFELRSASSNVAVFANSVLVRTITLCGDYEVKIADEFAAGAVPAGENTISIGSMSMGSGRDDMLSVDSWRPGAEGGGEAVHHSEGDSPLRPLLAGAPAGGCACSAPQASAAMPPSSTVACPGAQKWIALKNRFFATALASSTQDNTGFRATVRKNAASASYRPESVEAEAVFAGGVQKRECVFFLGPKKLSLLWRLGLRDVMEFGMWRWICYPVVWLLVAFHGALPSYGVAIILLTILVRLVFWPLTRKSTEGMKKMQELQPLIKEIQAKYKDNPQRLQQETWALYREKKVNPLSSCLPMFVQIPVFIALFNVLRSAVELRYAGFLWIGDLSAPEGLFKTWFPFGGLNILPLTMAGTMYLQSKLTPSTGDKSQQRMMTVFMPLMMLAMFYNFASALSLYWTVSQALSILQMWMIRRQAAKTAAVAAAAAAEPERQTRQMRRHS